MVGALGTAGCGAKPQGQGGDGGSGSGSGSGGSTYAVGGTITGLTGTGLVLHNGSEDLPVPAGATSFAFTTKVASGAGYAVSVTTEPSGPTQTCTVTNGSGIVSLADITNVAITCTP